MKKKIVIILSIILILFVAGCENNKKENKVPTLPKNSMFSNLNKIDLKCEPIKDIIDYNRYNPLFITSDGKLYDISFDKIFSNGTNCKEIESNSSFVRFMRGMILDSNNKLFDYNHYSEGAPFLEEYKDGSTIAPYGINKKISKDKYKYTIYSDNDQMYGSNIINSFIYEPSSKSIFAYRDINNSIDKTAIFILSEDEELEYLTYGGLKTNKGFYVYGRKISNKQECDKYADIPCNYVQGFHKLDLYDINENFSNIRFIWAEGIQSTWMTYFIVDTNNNIYTNVMGG